jgi:hypothetical protein
MISHPELMYLLASERQRELIAEADPFRHIRAARVARKAHRERTRDHRRPAGDRIAAGRPATTGRAGTLSTCGPSVAAPAR